MTSPSSSDPRSRFLVGIDLGTVNSALAYFDLAAEGDPADALRVMPIPQLVAPAEVGEAVASDGLADRGGDVADEEEVRSPLLVKP